MKRSTYTWLIAALALVGTSCGGDGDDASNALESVPDVVATGPATTIDAQELADDLAGSLEGQQAASGGGNATLTVGDTTWTFNSVLCAFGPDEIGDPEAEFVLSSLQDGLQLYVSIDGFGHSVSIDDIADFENQSVSLSAERFVAASNEAPEEFVEVNGKEIRATALFVDNLSDDPTPVEGTLEAVCP